MKLKYKLIIDAILFVLMIICMKYDFTGGILHEVLGFMLFAGLLFHIGINRKYYGMVLRPSVIDNLSAKHRAGLIINVVLLLALAIMIISSFAISKALLPAKSQMFGLYSFWRIMHISSAIVMLICMLTHVFLHGNMFLSQIKRHVSSDTLRLVYKGSLRIAAVVMALVVAKASFVSGVHMFDGLKKYDSNNQATYQDQPTTVDDSYNIPDTGNTPTIEEYLGSLNCNLCHRNCSLLAIQCGRGNQMVSQATEEYNNMYGN